MLLPSLLLTCLTLASSACADTLLHSVHQVREVCKQRQNGQPFDCTGTVIIPPLYSRAPFYIARENEVVRFYDLRTNRTATILTGDIVRLTGLTEPSGNASGTNPNCSGITVLSHSQLPTATPVGLRDLVRHNPPNRHVELRGYVHDVFPDDIDPHYTFIVLQNGEDFAYLAYPGGSTALPEFRPLCGSLVTVTGVTETEVLRHNCQRMLTIAGTNAFRVIRHSTDHRFDALPITDDDLNHPGDLAAHGPRKIRGTVLATWHDDTFLLVLTNGSPVKVELAEPSLPAISSCVEAVGNPETDLFHLSLVRASWRTTDFIPHTPSPVQTMGIKDVFVNPFGYHHIPIDAHGRVLRLTGTVKSTYLDERGRLRIILTDGSYAIPVDGSNLKRAVDEIKEGCFVEITGVCVMDSDIWRPSFMIPRVRGLFLVPRSDTDMKILRQPPWWTPVRFVTTLTVLLVLLVAILIWNVTLRVLVTRKSRALLREQAAKLEETLKIDERTRLAAELHDYLAQNLTVISYQISAAESALAAKGAEAADCLKTADRMLLACRADLRRCLWDLKSDALNEPDFAKAIERTSEPVCGDAQLLVRFAVNRNRLNDSTVHAVLSICRELVSNAVRHGKARKVQIAGELKDGVLRFSVRDDGLGFESAKRPGQSDGHFGLDGVAERIKRFNGQLQIDSHPGEGTRIVVTLRPKEPQA